MNITPEIVPLKEEIHLQLIIFFLMLLTFRGCKLEEVRIPWNRHLQKEANKNQWHSMSSFHWEKKSVKMAVRPQKKTQKEDGRSEGVLGCPRKLGSKVRINGLCPTCKWGIPWGWLNPLIRSPLILTSNRDIQVWAGQRQLMKNRWPKLPPNLISHDIHKHSMYICGIFPYMKTINFSHPKLSIRTGWGTWGTWYCKPNCWMWGELRGEAKAEWYVRNIPMINSCFWFPS